jgi:glutamate--cysteine ligase
MLNERWGFEEYVDYILDVPMFLIRRGADYINMTGQTFREYMERGYQGHRATEGDFELHLSTAFPEVRMKRFIEVRGADAGPRDMLLALPALYKGIFYWEPAREAARDLFSGVSPDELRQVHASFVREGIHATTRWGSGVELGRRLVEISSQGLKSLAAECGEPDEVEFLAPLVVMLERGRSLADDLADDLASAKGDWRPILHKWEL